MPLSLYGRIFLGKWGRGVFEVMEKVVGIYSVTSVNALERIVTVYCHL